jgi:hypothetical protein
MDIPTETVARANHIILGFPDDKSGHAHACGFRTKPGWPLHLPLPALGESEGEQFAENTNREFGIKRSLLAWRDNTFAFHKHLPHQPLLLVRGIYPDVADDALSQLETRQNAVHGFVSKIFHASTPKFFIDRLDPLDYYPHLAQLRTDLSHRFPEGDPIDGTETEKRTFKNLFDAIFMSPEYGDWEAFEQLLLQQRTMGEVIAYLKEPPHEKEGLYGQIIAQINQRWPLMTADIIAPAPPQNRLSTPEIGQRLGD